METLDNSSTFYERNNTLTLKQIPKEGFQPNLFRWHVEKCKEYNLINDTKKNFSEHIYEFNRSQIICLESAPTLTNFTIIKASVLVTLAVLSFCGNTATIVSLKTGRARKSRSRAPWTAFYSLLLQLSIADLFVTIFCLAGEAGWSLAVQWYAGNTACKLFKFLQMFSLYLSTFVLVLIGVDRWLAVKYPMKSVATATRSERLVIAAWCFSFILSIPQAVVFRVARGPFVEEFYQCVTHGFYTERWQEQAYTSFSLLFMFVLPLIVLVSTYVSTVRTIAKSAKVLQPELTRETKLLSIDLNRRRLIDRAKMKSLRMSFVIVATFLLWWTPYYVMMIIFTFLDPDKEQSDDLVSYIFFFGMSNSLVNPVIYGAFHLWPKKKRSQSSDRQYGGCARLHNRATDQSSSIRLTTVRSLRSSLKNCNANNQSFL